MWQQIISAWRRSGAWFNRSKSRQRNRTYFVEAQSLEVRVLLSAWNGIGPAPVLNGQVAGNGAVSGRITGIAADPADVNTIYITSAGGGVWKTTTGGSSWTPLTDNLTSGGKPLPSFMGAVAETRDASNQQIVYAGMGEANNADSFYGDGILVSQDGGANWTLTDAGGALTGQSVSKISIDPNDTSGGTAYAAVADFGANHGLSDTGIWKTTNFGTTWTNTTSSLPFSPTQNEWSDVVVDPAVPGTVYAAEGTFYGSTGNGVYKTTDGGGTWSWLTGSGSFNGTQDGRIALALYDSGGTQELVVSISVPTSLANSEQLFKLLKSTDGGVSFNTLASTPNYLRDQGSYDTVLAISPKDPNYIYAAGAMSAVGPTFSGSPVESLDGGISWLDIATDATGNGPHTDSHAAAFDAAGNLLDGDDGGIFKLTQPTDKVNQRWSDLNTNLSTIQFTGIAVDPTNANIAYGGSQDNGIEKFTGGSGWAQLQDGDGGITRVDPTNHNRIYAEHTDTSIQRSDNAGATFTNITSGLQGNAVNFYAPYVLDSSGDILYGEDWLNRSTDHGVTWTQIAKNSVNGFNPSDANIDAIAVAASSNDVIYVSAGSKIYMTQNATAGDPASVTWTDVSLPSGLRAGASNSLAVDPANPGTAYAVVVGFGHHVFKTTNYGADWTEISVNLINTFVASVSANGPIVYVGTDVGVYATNNAGATWSRLGTGLPNARVVELEVLPSLQILAAGTHGRGMSELDIAPSTLTNVTSSTADGNYGIGTTISINVRFNDTVTVTGTPQLALNSGGTASYASGSTTNTLTFTYTVQAGDNSARLDYMSTSALSLNGGTITDSILNAAVLALPAPSAAGSLGATGNIVIDTIAPSASSFVRQTPSTSPTNVNTLVFRTTFTEVMTNVGTSSFQVAGTTTAAVSNVTQVAASNGTQYDVTVSGGDLATFSGDVGLDLSGSQSITDLAGNALPSTKPAIDQTYSVDHLAPSVTINLAAGQPATTTASSIAYTVVFSEAASGFTNGNVVLGGTAGATTAVVQERGPLDGTTYTVTVSGMQRQGTVTATLNSGAASDAAGNPSQAATTSGNSVQYNIGAQFTVTSQTVSENVGTVTVAVQLTAASDTDVSLPFTLDGTASSPDEYTASASPLVIHAGQTSGDITLTIINTNVVKPTKDVIVTLETPTSATLGANIQSTVDITNQNGAYFSISGGSAVAGSVIPFVVNLSAPVEATTSVTVTTSDVTAHAGTNYTALSSFVVNFAPLQTSQTVNVTTLFDGNAEPNQTFTGSLGGLNNGGQNVSLLSATAVGTILTNTTGTPQLSINNASVSKGTSGTSTAQLAVTLTQRPPAGQQVTVHYATQTTGSAIPNTDFIATSGDLTFTSSGALTQMINLSIIGNTTPTPNRTINVLLSSPTNAGILVNTGVIMINSSINVPPQASNWILLPEQAHEHTPYSINYATLLGASNAQDANGDTIQFRITFVVPKATTTITHNGVTTPVVPGSTLMGPGDTVTWTGNPGYDGGTLLAFNVVAFDGALSSSTITAVNLNIDALGTAYDLSGPWTVEGPSGTVLGLGSITQTGANIALTNAGSVGSSGQFTAFSQLVVPNFNGTSTVTATGTVDTSTADDGRIVWRDGSGNLLAVWLRNSLGGEYSVLTSGSSTPTLGSVTQAGTGLTFVNGANLTSATITSPTGLQVGVSTATYGDGKITFANGDVWTKLDLAPDYTSSSGGFTHARQFGPSVTFVDKFGNRSLAFWLTPTELWASQWNETVVVGNGKLIWSSGTVWDESLILNGIGNGKPVTIAASPSRINVISYYNPAGKLVYMVETSPMNVVFIDSIGDVSLGTWANPSQIITPRYPNDIATLVPGGQIHWSDGGVWTQTNVVSSTVTVIDYTNTIGAPTHVINIAGSNSLAFVEGLGRTSLGNWIDPGHTQALADLYPGDKAIFGAGPISTVTWDDGGVWTQTNAVPLLLLFTDGNGAVSHVQLTSQTTLIGLDGPLAGLTGTRVGGQIHWSNGALWHGFDFNTLNALYEMGSS